MTEPSSIESEVASLRTEVQALRRALAQSEDRLRLIVESVKDFSIFSVDPEGNIATWNTGAERIFGYSESEIIGRHAALLFTPEDRAIGAPQQELTDALETGRGEDERWHLRKDGRLFYASGMVTPIRDDAGTLRGFTKVARDMTAAKLAAEERERLHASERAARAEAEAANKAKDHFLASLSHELRTPLTPVLLTACNLRNDETLPAHLRQDLDLICANVQLEARLIDDLLDLTRIETGKLHLDCAILDLHELVAETLQIVGNEAEEKSIEIDLQLAAQEHHVWADRARLKQVVWNVLKNAIKFTPRGGQVTLTSANSEGAIQLEIRDNGIGIPAHVLPKLFTSFEQGSALTTLRFGGVGLGLAISRAITDLHGGHISAASEGPGHGSIFTLSLQAADAVSGQASTDTDLKKVCTGLRVLLVEDHEPTAFVLTRLLKKRGHDVAVANTIREALQVAATAEDRQLLISDIGLPDGTGYDLVAQLQSRQRKLPAIAISGYGMEADTRRSAASGFGAHLIKPVDMEKVDAAIFELCGEVCDQIEVSSRESV